MKELDKYLGILAILVAAFLILSKRQGFDSAISGVGALNIASIGAFQGNCINAFGVQVGNCGGKRSPVGTGSDPIVIFE